MRSGISSSQELSLNRMQLTSALFQAKKEVNITGRATGKSTGKAWKYHKHAQTMARGTGAIVGATYAQMLKITLVPALEAMAGLGYHRDVHYVIGKAPPKNGLFRNLPYQAPLSWERFLLFYTGFGYHLASQDREDSNRGFNLDVWDADEGLTLDQIKLQNVIVAANRGNRRYFGHNPLHHGWSITSSMPVSAKGNWLLDYGKYYEQDGHDIWITWNKVCALQMELLKSHNNNERNELISAIAYLKKQIHFYKDKDGLLFTVYNAFDNIQNLGWDYIKEMYRTMSETSFRLEVLNERITGVANGFYKLEQRHYYRAYNYEYIDGLEFDFSRIKEDTCLKDGDVTRNMPLDMSIDWGAEINAMWISQPYSNKEYRFLKSIYVKHPHGLRELTEKFAEYYKPHKNRRVLLWYDHTAIARDAVRQAYVDEMVKLLRSAGWEVTLKYIGKAPEHFNKFLLWEILLRGGDDRFPEIKFNQDNCKDGLLSMQLAGVKQGLKGFQKDKSSERSKIIPRQQATDFSDAADIPVWGRFSQLMDRKRVFMDTRF